MSCNIEKKSATTPKPKGTYCKCSTTQAVDKGSIQPWDQDQSGTTEWYWGLVLFVPTVNAAEILGLGSQTSQTFKPYVSKGFMSTADVKEIHLN